MDTKTVKELLYNFLKKDNTLVEGCMETFKHHGIVYDEPLMAPKDYVPSKVYAFIGMGCGGAYLTGDGRSKDYKILDEIYRDVVRKLKCEMIEEKFTEEEKKYYEEIGCPLLAIFQQDENIQVQFVSRVVKFGKEVLGIKKIGYRSYVD